MSLDIRREELIPTSEGDGDPGEFDPNFTIDEVVIEEVGYEA